MSGDTLPEPTIEAASDTVGSGEPAPPPESDPCPARVGRFRIDGELGRGGMGVVYRAFDPEVGREVALKVVLTSRARRMDLLVRFTREARLTAQLQHPVIVPVYEVGATAEGAPYFVMRLVRGETLAGLIARPRPRYTLYRLLEMLLQVGRALHYAHARGVVHRDLKPQNIMIGAFGDVHVMDWGLAKPFGVRDAIAAPGGAEPPVLVPSDVTGDGTVMGTPGYMAPEQAGGDGGALGPAVDVYALGGCLYALLTGHAPREGPTSKVLTDLALGQPIEAPGVHGKRVPPALESLCLRALSPDPLSRPESAAAFCEEVEAWLDARAAHPEVSAEDRAFLESYDARAFRRPSVTVDVVGLSGGAAPRVLLARRDHPPFRDAWALPGAFVDVDESLEDAARRILRDECGLPDTTAITQVGAFGALERDPRTRVITVAFRADATPEEAAAAETERRRWFAAVPDGAGGIALTPPAAVAFDHARIIAAALGRG